MSFVTLENGFQYDKPILNALKTARRHAAEARKLQNDPDPQKRYGGWMNSRRESAYEAFAEDQANQVHSVAYYVNGAAVCTCGLVTSYSDRTVPIEAFYNADGHIDSARKLVSFFVVEVYKNQKCIHTYYCQTCGVLEPTALDGDDVDLAKFEAEKAGHTHG